MAQIIELTRGYFTIVDDEDYELLSQFKWRVLTCRDEHNYAVRHIGDGHVESVHRVILGLAEGDGQIVDHIDGDGLNNVRSNLRICTHSQNMANRRRHKKTKRGYPVGVHFNGYRYSAQLRKNGVRHHGPSRSTPEEAGEDYLMMAKEFHGEFAISAV